MASTSGKTIVGKGKRDGQGRVVGSRSLFIKNIRKADGTWLADEMKPNLTLIEDRLMRVSPRVVRELFSIELLRGMKK